MLTSATDDDHNDDLLPYKEVGRILRVTPQTVSRRVDAGDLEAVVMNGRPRVRRGELNRYLASLGRR